MTCISITEFGGLNTDKSARNKQRVFAQVAHNCLLTDGSLRPMPAWTLFSTLPANKCTEDNFIYEDSRDGRILAAVDYKDAVYLTGKPFARDLLVGIDIAEHETLFGMPTNLRAAENADSINGDRPLGLPTPNFNVHFSASSVGYSAQLLSLKPVNRILGVSFCRQTVSGFEESTIAVIPEQTPYGIMFEGDIVSVSLSLDMDEINDAKITHVRLYRTISGLDTGEQVTNELDTDWFLLDTIAVVPTINYNDGGAVTTDPMDLYLAKHFYPPSFNAGHFGLTESGWFYMVACDGRGALSERFLHHAWPTENKFYIPQQAIDVVTNYDTIYIGTNAKPYFVAVGPGEGEQGVQVSAIPFQERLPCLPRTMVVAPGGAIYASHHGLVSLSKSGQKVITSGLTNPGDTLYDNGTIKASIGETKLGAFWNGSYFGFCADVSPDVCNIEVPEPEPEPPVEESTLLYVANGGTGKLEHYAVPGFANVGESIIAGPAGNISIVCANSDKSTLFISSPDFDYIAFLNVAGNSVDVWIDSVLHPDFLSPLGLVVSPDDLSLYATHVDNASGNYSVSKFNIADPSIIEAQHIYTGSYLGRGEISVNPAGTFVYPTTFLTQQILKFSSALALLDEHVFIDDPLNQEPVSSVYLADAADNNDYVLTVPAQGMYPQILYFFNPSTLSIVYQVSLTGAQGNGSMCVLPDKSKVYVCGNISEHVSVVDISTFPPTLLTTITMPVGSRPRRCAASAAGGYVCVTDANLAQFYIIDPATDTIVSTIPTGAGGNGCIFL